MSFNYLIAVAYFIDIFVSIVCTKLVSAVRVLLMKKSHPHRIAVAWDDGIYELNLCLKSKSAAINFSGMPYMN